MARVEGDADTSFFDSRPMDTPPVAGALEALHALTAGPFEGRVHLVSKAGPAMEQRTRQWLGHVGFHTRTGIPAGHVHFVAKRPDKEPVCTRLGVTHFVDDRLDVLRVLTSVPHRFFFVGERGEKRPPYGVPHDVVTVADWTELGHQMLDTL